MAPRELVVLGTASQVPTRTRNHNGYVLRWDGMALMFDPGEGTQRQLLLAHVTAPSISRICITHLHGDHCLGLPGVLARRAVDGAREPATLHFPAASSADVVALRRAGAPFGSAVAFEAPVAIEDGGAALHVVGHGRTPQGGDWTLTAAALDHRVATVGYRLQEPDGVQLVPELLTGAGLEGPVVGQLVRRGRVRAPSGRIVTLAEVSRPRAGQAFAFVMDTRLCRGAELLAENVDLLVVESTYLDRDADLAFEYGHLTAGQAGELAKRCGARRVVLTHFSRRYGDAGEPFAAQARAAAGDSIDVVAANDLDVVPVPARR